MVGEGEIDRNIIRKRAEEKYEKVRAQRGDGAGSFFTIRI